MKAICKTIYLIVAVFSLLITAPVLAQHSPSGAVDGAANQNPYAPYEFLIGEWDVSPEGRPSQMVMRFQWRGTAKGYILFSASLLEAGGKEDLHFEGILIWNAVHQNLDMLVTLDPVNGTTQESGTLFIEPDGTVVRSIVSTGPRNIRGADGKLAAGSSNFRQTFKQMGPGRVRTVVMRETKNGWEPTFPGSDNLIMTKRAASMHGR